LYLEKSWKRWASAGKKPCKWWWASTSNSTIHLVIGGMTLTWTVLVAHTSMCDAHHCAVADGRIKLFGRQPHFATRGDRRPWPGRALYSQELRNQRETLQVMCDRLHHGCAKLQREFREQERGLVTVLESGNGQAEPYIRKLAERMNKSKENIEHLKAQLLQQQGRVDHCQAELRRMDETEVRSPSRPKQHFALQACRIKKQVAQRDAKRKLAASRIASKHKQQVRLERRCAKHLLEARFADHLDHD